MNKTTNLEFAYSEMAPFMELLIHCVDINQGLM